MADCGPVSPAAQVTIVVPNWNTGPLLRICLASLIRFTKTPYRIVVVDNGSQDGSRQTAEQAAAQGLIQLIRRDDAPNDGANTHAAALDAGLAATSTPFVFALDSDAWARREGWLQGFLDPLGDACSHAGALKFPGGRVKQVWDWVRGKQHPPEARYIRPCHALYRTGLLREHALSFAPYQGPDGRWRTTGERIHERLGELGHPCAILSHAAVEDLVGHLRHATMVLNASHYPGLRARTRRRGEAQIRRLLASREARTILDQSPLP